MAGMYAGTNARGIEAVLQKALKRAHWYATNYRGAMDFEKRLQKQYFGVLTKFVKKHDLTVDQGKVLCDSIPAPFSGNAKLITGLKARL
jgi:hypothetical protein